LTKADVGEVRRIANLAKIRLTEDEEKRYAMQLGRILEYFSNMDKVDVKGASPWSYLHSQPTTRADKAVPCEPDAILRLAPRMKGRYIRAPRM